MSGRRLLAAGLIAAGVAGCGGSGHGGSASSSSSTTAAGSTTRTGGAGTAPPAHRSRPRIPAGPRVGAHQKVVSGGAHLVVTVRGVLALRHTGTASLPGDRQLGVQLQIANDAGETYDSTASGDVSLVLSRGAAQPLFVKRGVCTTPLVDFESLIGTGVVRDGCVGFSVPRGARVLAVRFSPHSRPRGALTWRTGAR